MRCEADDPAWLTDPGVGWTSLDRKLAAALTEISHGELGRVLSQLTTRSMNMSIMKRGRALLAAVFRYYAHGNNGQALYDMNHLQSLKMRDSNLESLHNSWDMIMTELAFVPDLVLHPG